MARSTQTRRKAERKDGCTDPPSHRRVGVTPARPGLEWTPKYHLFKLEAGNRIPTDWRRDRLGDILIRREELADFASDPDRLFTVMTIAQTGDIRPREPGKGRNPPEWYASYFEESPGTWYAAHSGDVVFSSIDLWKGCIALVPERFDGALVTKEFPIYQVRDARLLPEFLQALLRSRYNRLAVFPMAIQPRHRWPR